ncbi:MAG: hypothetical protein QM608_05330 [Caulobacter sp.]
MDFSDERWAGLLGGYRRRYDPRHALLAVEAGQGAEAAWSELWEELHHQGDVDLASYAAVPHLARLAAAGKAGGWNAFSLAAIIEQERGVRDNPLLPAWLADDYHQAWNILFEAALSALRNADDMEVVNSVLAVVAICKGLPVLGRLAGEFSEAERQELLAASGWA